MANKKFWLGMLVVVLAFGMTVVGCEVEKPEETHTMTFVNQSSFAVTVTCSDLNPSEFTVNAGATKTATSSISMVQFLYQPADKVVGTNPSPGRIVFTNR